MRRIAERLLKERGDEPLSLLFDQSMDRESSIGKDDRLRSWMMQASRSGLSNADERPLMPIRLTSERLRMPFRMMINEPEGIAIDYTIPASHLLRMSKQLKQAPIGLNELSTAVDAANAVLTVWREEKGPGWSISPQGMARPVEETWDTRCIMAGPFHKTPLWPVIRKLTSECLGSGIFSMEMVECAEMESEALLEAEYESPNDQYIKAAKKECWMKPWWNAAVAELWNSKQELDMKRLRKKVDPGLLEEAVLILQAIAEYDQQGKDSWVEAEQKKMTQVLENSDFIHESAFSQIIWGVNDGHLVDSIDAYLEGRMGQFAVYNWIEITRINDGIMEQFTNEHLYRQRCLIRSQVEAWARKATDWLEAR